MILIRLNVNEIDTGLDSLHFMHSDRGSLAGWDRYAHFEHVVRSAHQLDDYSDKENEHADHTKQELKNPLLRDNTKED